MYFSFDATLKNTQRITYPKSLVEFLLQGSGNGGSPYDFSALSFESLQYAELAVNISRNFGDMLSIGVRPKILYGLATVTTQENVFTLETSAEEWIIDAHSAVRMAATGVPLPVDSSGVFDPSGTIETVNWSSPSDIIGSGNKNRGFGIDFGLHFRPIDRLEFSASLLDLGYINWADQPQSIIIDGTYAFQGLNLNTPDSIGKLDQILDTLKENLSVTGSTEPFKTSLTPKLILGGRIFITPGFDVGLLSRTEFLPGKIDQDIILLTNLRPMKAFNMTASYSMLGKGHNTIGLGFGFKIGPANTYFISEYNPFRYDRLTEGGEPYNYNIPLKSEGFPFDINIPVIMPVDVYKLSFRFGANFVMGCNKAKKLRRDKPMFNATDWAY
jgi:hypothetical protein